MLLMIIINLNYNNSYQFLVTMHSILAVMIAACICGMIVILILIMLRVEFVNRSTEITRKEGRHKSGTRREGKKRNRDAEGREGESERGEGRENRRKRKKWDGERAQEEGVKEYR